MAVLVLAASAHAQKLPLGGLPPGKVALVIQSHHDDHTWQFGFGGFIAKLNDAGFTSYFIRTTNDEKDSRDGWGRGDQINHRESVEATRHLGMKEVISLNWRNDHMDSVPIKEIRAQYILLIRKLRPDVLMTWNPWGHYDRNPDHRKVARAAGEAAWMAGLSNVHPEHIAAGLAPHRVPRVYYTQRHDYGRGYVPNIAIQIAPTQVRRAEAAYHAHKNVRANEPANFMESAMRATGAKHGVDFAEEFYYRDEWDHLPGLVDYLKAEVKTR